MEGNWKGVPSKTEKIYFKICEFVFVRWMLPAIDLLTRDWQISVGFA